MRREHYERVSRDLEAASDSIRRRFVRRDLLMNVIVAAFVGLLAFVVMPPSNIEWPLVTQVTVAAVVAVGIFGFASVLFVLPELFRELG